MNKDIEYIFNNFSIIYPTSTSIATLIRMITAYSIQGKKIHDANIIAVAMDNNINRIFTNNIADFSFAEKEGFELIGLEDE